MIKRFAGRLNKDDKEQDLSPVEHLAARNGRFYGGEQGLTFENVRGNYLIPNSNLPAGTNECIGSFYDSVNRRIIWFNYNSNGNHGIYIFYVETQVIAQVFRCGVNSATDILNFSLNYPVHSSALVYRTEGDGDLLYWTDGFNRPRYINIDTVSSLSPFTEDMINAGKNAPLSPPTFPAAAGTNGVFGYFSDATVSFNAVKNRYFRFAYRWVYQNGEKSTLSPISVVPLPWLTFPNLQPNETVFNYIKVIVTSPDLEDFEAIEIFGQEFNGVTWGDFFIIEKLGRTEYAIPLNSAFTYSFYNNGSYTFLDPEVSDLYFDWLPDKANTLELLNGNVLIYGGITEGYDNLQRDEVDVTITASLTSLDPILATIPNVSPTFGWGKNERFGILYFDERGKTNGVVSFVADVIDTTDFAVTTPIYPGQTTATTIQVPLISASINHTPPTSAVSYQWARVNLMPKFLHWVTMDYQTDNEYLYLGIENLVQMNVKSKFLPSYEYNSGDRLRILGKFTGDNTITAFSVQQDYEVLGVVQRIMSSPASLGAFIKIPKPTSFPTPTYGATMLVEVYTPIERVPNNRQLFYEWGEKYDIYESGGQRYHRGQIQDQTAIQPALFEWTNGDVYTKRRAFFLAVPIENNTTYSFADMMDANFNDYVASSANANGRAWVINEDAATVYNPVLVRWGGKYQQGTNLNGLNRFRPADFDEVDRAKGDIRRFKARDRILRVFQDRGVGQYGVYARFIQNNEGVPELVTTNEIITTNNINYYQGTYGLCGYPTNLVSTQYADYFMDVVTGRAIRLAPDGMTDLGLIYKGQYYFSNLVTPYNKEILRSNGAISKVMGFFDYFENQFHTILQGGTNAFGTYSAYNFSFNESRNAFCCDIHDFNPEWAIGADDKAYTWLNGNLYKHDTVNSSGAAVPYCQYYGVNYNCELTVVFNDNILQKKSWQSIVEVASDTWDCPEIYTNVMSYGTQRQQTSLISAEFTKLEQNPSSAIKRDAFSRGGKINGQSMKGNWLVIKFRKENAQSLINLSEIQISFVDSPLTRKQ